ncbi:MAG TPA: sugar ABC transporter permease [Streptosporangiaceae bacterium]|jgi:multiple sugar transport system permease protein
MAAVTRESPGTADTAPPVPRRAPLMTRLRRIGLPYLLCVPAIVLELLVHVVPMLAGVVMSFYHLTRLYLRNWQNAPFAGLSNYKVSLQLDNAVGQSLLASFARSIAFTVLSVGFAWLLGFGASVVLQGKVRGRGFWRTLFLFPYALPLYASVFTWTFMFQRDNGLINQLLVHDLHLFTPDKAPFWLLGGNSFYALVITEIWQKWPFAFLMLMAGMQNIPGDLFEAASIDGAGVGMQIRKIVMPMLRPVNVVVILVLFLWTFNDFNTPYLLFGFGSVPDQADLLSIHIYSSTFQNQNFGLGSAQSVLLLLFLLVVTAVYLMVTRRRRDAV